MERRSFLCLGSSCAAYIYLSSAASPQLKARFAARPGGVLVAREPWGRIERVADGVWAVISTPLAEGDDARVTLANGGIIAGSDGVVVVEGFASDRGANWIVDQTIELTGRAPTHVLLTHYHGDHAAGLAAYQERDANVRYVTSEATRSTLSSQAEEQGRGGEVVDVLSTADLVESSAPHRIDLGGRVVEVTARNGHTSSDLTLGVEDPRVVYCGDLVWNELVPNYMDATPSVLSQQVRDLLVDRGEVVYVPGHGSIPSVAELSNYVGLLDDIEEAARRAFEAGTPSNVAANAYEPSAAVGEWVEFSDAFLPRAFAAWERELKGA